MALALFFLALVAMPAAMKFSVRRPEYVTPEKIPTYPKVDICCLKYRQKRVNASRDIFPLI